MPNKLQIFISYDVMLEYICAKKIHHNVLNNANILKKGLKWFLDSMKFVVYTKHHESIWLK
jgi:hypothetical protein